MDISRPAAPDLDGRLSPTLSAARFSRLENVTAVSGLPRPDALDVTARASLFGCTEAELVRTQSTLREIVDRSARELLAEASFRAACEQLSRAEQSLVVTIGDSITADRLSWAEMLAAALASTPRPLQLVNLAVSGGTTADLLPRADAIARLRPSWVIAMIGTNDVRRHGVQGIGRMTSLQETDRNLDVFSTLVTRHIGSRLALITPPPVDEARAVRCEVFRDAGITWRSDDISEIAEIVRRRSGTVIDINRDLSSQAAETFLTPDGVHPSVAGQKQIARTVAIALAAASAQSHGGRAPV
jgi:lysophospholipase L1-like esterase